MRHHDGTEVKFDIIIVAFICLQVKSSISASCANKPNNLSVTLTRCTCCMTCFMFYTTSNTHRVTLYFSVSIKIQNSTQRHLNMYTHIRTHTYKKQHLAHHTFFVCSVNITANTNTQTLATCMPLSLLCLCVCVSDSNETDRCATKYSSNLLTCGGFRMTQAL